MESKLRCQKCGSFSVSVTLIGVLIGQSDPNYTRCHDCGERGKISDLDAQIERLEALTQDVTEI